MNNSLVRIILLLTFVTLTCLSFGYADTITLKNGSTLDGTVVSADDQTVVMQMDTMKMTFTRAEVSGIEKNDKKTDFTKLSIVQGQKHEESLQERTGLTREQRDLVMDAMGALASDNATERSAARKQLASLNKKMPIAQYLAEIIRFSKGNVVPELMQVITELAPEKSKELLQGYSSAMDPLSRGKALELIGNTQNKEGTQIVARGLVDIEPNVCISAAHAAAALGEKGMTPALIEALKNNDPRVQNAAKDALSELWSKGSTKVQFDSSEEWQRYWKKEGSAVKDAVDTSELKPLVTQEEFDQSTIGHE